jgi:hypothetical protein
LSVWQPSIEQCRFEIIEKVEHRGNDWPVQWFIHFEKPYEYPSTNIDINNNHPISFVLSGDCLILDFLYVDSQIKRIQKFTSGGINQKISLIFTLTGSMVDAHSSWLI